MSQVLPLTTTDDIAVEISAPTDRPDPQALIRELRADFGDDALLRFERALRLAHAAELDELGFGYAGSVLRGQAAN